MKIYIVGAGGVGGYFGGLLAKTTEDVTFVAQGEHFRAIKNNGLLVKSVVGDFTIKPAKIIENISEITNPDLIIFSVKTYDTETVAKKLNQVVNPNTLIITFQNGVDNDTQIKKYIKTAKVYPGVAYLISAKTKPGVIEQTGGLNKLFFGDRQNSQNLKLKEVEKIMRKAEIDATVSDDITRDLWKKFLFILPFAGMTAICRSRVGKILKNPITRPIYERCLKEAIEVARALVVNLPDDIFEMTMTVAIKTSPQSKSSLLVDIENRRRTEIETLHGTLVRFAKEKNIDVPINELIYGAIKLSQ